MQRVLSEDVCSGDCRKNRGRKVRRRHMSRIHASLGVGVMWALELCNLCFVKALAPGFAHGVGYVADGSLCPNGLGKLGKSFYTSNSAGALRPRCQQLHPRHSNSRRDRSLRRVSASPLALGSCWARVSTQSTANARGFRTTRVPSTLFAREAPHERARKDDGGGIEPGPEESAAVPPGSWLSLAMLLLVYVNNQWSRSLVYYVQNFDITATADTAKEFMNLDIGFDETQYGLLASFSFTLLFSLFSLVAGRAVDVVSRKTATVSSCVVWSTMALGTAVANTFPEIFGLRVVQGSAQAFTTPAAYTMINDLFPASSRGTANAIYSSGVYLGGAFASLSLLLNGRVGWRNSHIVVALVGLAMAAISGALIREPQRESTKDDSSREPSALEQQRADVAALKRRSSSDQAAQESKGVERAERRSLADDEDCVLPADEAGTEARESFLEALAVVFESNTVRLLFLATAFRFCAGFGIGVWSAPFFRGAYPSSTSEFSVLNAFVVAGGGLFSSYFGGVISDKFSAQEPRVRAWVPMLGCLLAVPCWIGVVSGRGFYTSLAFLLAEYMVAECWFGPTVTILQEGLPTAVRGVGQGVFSTLSAFGTLAPPLMGALMNQGGFERDTVLLWSVPSFYVISAIGFYFVGESIVGKTRVKQEQDP